MVDEVAIALLGHSTGVVGDCSLSDIPVISADTPGRPLVHYAAMVSTDPDVHVRRPLTMRIVAPPLCTKFVSALWKVYGPRASVVCLFFLP